jgi:hypothetical protein
VWLRRLTAGHQLARVAAASTNSGAGLPTALAISETEACPLGGSMSISGNVASSSGLVTGDNITITASSCAVSSGGVTSTTNGRMTLAMASGSIVGIPFHAVVNVTATDLSVQTGGTTLVSSGDARLDWTASSATSQTLIATGSSITSRETVAGALRTNTLRNYSQTLTISGLTLSSTMAATVETDGTAFGGGSYTITTPTAVVWNASTGAVLSGVVKVVGAANSQLLATVGSGSTVTIQVDANGDGTFEKTLTSTQSELKSLR